MALIKDAWQANDDSVERAFLLQFEGDEEDIKKKLELYSLGYYRTPVADVIHTGLFGLLDALIDLGLTGSEIMNFYIHGHIEPYDDRYSFTKGIIEIVHGMSEIDIANKYGRYFSDERIVDLSNPSRNTQMLISFCYDKDDTYEFIPDKDDLYDKFHDAYSSRFDCWNNSNSTKEFQKIDGKLFRAVHFVVCHGYNFPEIESLFNEQIKDIVFKQTNGENLFILNKDFARKMSNTLLGLVSFLKKYNYVLFDSESLFDPKCDSITFLDPNGKQIVLNRSYLESDVSKYAAIIEKLDSQKLVAHDIISLCDKRKTSIEVCYLNKDIKHSLNVKRDKLFSAPQELFMIIKRGYDWGFNFQDIDNLFDSSQKLLKVIDPNGKEQLVIREQFNNMLEIIVACEEANFSVNYNHLFDISNTMVELVDKQGQKALIARDRIIHMMDIFLLLTQKGYRFKDYSNLFDENEPYIASYNKQDQEIILSRKQINRIIKLQNLSDKQREELTESEKDLLLMLHSYSIRQKLFEWLPYTAKKWIPSPAIINKIPAEKSYEYFYNNNYERLRVLKEKYQAKNYQEMEGIVSIGYILGLFNSKKSVSEKAMEYIIDYFLKKGITAYELHTTYGAINLGMGYNKKFADFFMQHYAMDCDAFIEPDLGTNMTKELFERFDEVLEKRPEKRIKTRTINKLLTPLDAMASIIDVEVDKEMLGEKADDERYIALVGLLMKFGATKDELQWAIELYEQALAIDEQKVSIPNIEDIETSLMRFTSHLKSDPQAFLSGRKTNCCSTYGGEAQDRLTHIITDPDWRYVSFSSPNRTFFDGLVWYDKKDKVVCIDNVEGQFSKLDKNNPESIPMMADTIIRYADEIYHRMNKLNIPCRKVNVGKYDRTDSWEIFKYAWEQNLIIEDHNPCNYPKRNEISTNGSEQFTITDEKMLRLRGK